MSSSSSLPSACDCGVALLCFIILCFVVSYYIMGPPFRSLYQGIVAAQTHLPCWLQGTVVAFFSIVYPITWAMLTCVHVCVCMNVYSTHIRVCMCACVRVRRRRRLLLLAVVEWWGVVWCGVCVVLGGVVCGVV